MSGINFKLSFAEIIGKPAQHSWVQAAVIKDELLAKGQLFFLLKIHKPHTVEISSLGKQVAQVFEETYLETKDDAFNSLKKALEIIQEQQPTVEIAAGVLIEHILYLGTLGKTKISLVRGEKIINLLVGVTGISIVSGFVKDKDLLFISTSECEELLTTEKINQTLVTFTNPQEIVDELAPQVLAAEENSSCGSLVMKFTPETKTFSEETEEEVKEVVASSSHQPSFSNNRPSFPVEKLKNILKTIRTKAFTAPDKVEFSFQKNKKKQALIIALILITILASSVIFGLKKEEEQKIVADFEKTYQDAKVKYEEGSAILELNDTQARNFLNSAKKDLETKLALIKNQKTPEYQKGRQLLKQINDALSSVGGVYKSSAPEVFYDLTLIKDGAVGNRLAVYQKNVAILDQKNSTIYQLNLDSKSGETIAGEKDSKGASFVAHDGEIYFYQDGQGVKEINLSNKRVTVAIKNDTEWGAVGDLAAYGGNLYLLDKTRGKIVKYTGLNDGFSAARNYLVEGVSPDFSKSISLTIDGSVWVLNSDNTVAKFTRGSPDSFSVTGVEPPLTAPTRIYASEETQNIYFLEPSKNRVVVLAKDGVYQVQYLWSGVSSVTDLVVLEDSKKILLMAGSKIYALNLK